MKVTFKTVKGTSFSIEVDDSLSVGNVKAVIQESQGADFPADSMSIIHQGKILKDDTSLGANGVSEAGFCVVMVKKKVAPPPEPKQAEAAPAPAAAAEAPAEAPAAPAVPAAAPATAPAAVPAAAPAQPVDAYAAAASELATGSELEAKIAQICEMGFPREEVARAMRAAYNNPERAVEYLMGGIPAGLEGPPPVARPPAAAAPAAAGASVAAAPAAAPASAAAGEAFNMFGGGGGGGGGAPAAAVGPLAALRSDPQFTAMRALVQQRPELLQPMLAELGRSNPQLLQTINENQAEFLALMNEPVAEGEGGMAAIMQQLAAGMEDEGGDLPPGAVEVELTQEETEAVGRLEALGFDRSLCIEAFLICDKNEALAANYLLEHGGDMM